MRIYSKLAGQSVLQFSAALACVGLMSSSALAGPKPKPVSGAARWAVTTYYGEHREAARSTPLPGGGVSFNFLTTPDRSELVTAHPSYKKVLLGNQLGKTFSATIAITAAPGTIFNYYHQGNPDNTCVREANVRLYFETKNEELGESQFWWSNPVSIDLADLLASGGTTLTVVLSPEFWSDRAGGFGNSDAAHEAAFIAAASNISLTGLSFGGGCWFAFGAGSNPGGATFELLAFTSTE